MHSYTESRTMAFTREQIFSLAADIERYHEFLP
jgi:ribosome-associated toxin RatA of RatAB toxin-antitoxin module